MSSFPSLSAFHIRRKRPLMLAPPASLPTGLEIDYELDFSPAVVAEPVAAPSTRWEDLRFFATCYLVGLVFFLVMLS